jgi:hypothetical protein
MGAAVGFGRNYLRPLHFRQQSANLLSLLRDWLKCFSAPGRADDYSKSHSTAPAG